MEKIQPYLFDLLILANLLIIFLHFLVLITEGKITVKINRNNL